MRVFDIHVACEQIRITPCLVPHAEARIAEAELQDVADVFRGDHVLARGE